MEIGVLSVLLLLWVMFHYWYLRTGSLLFQILNRWVRWFLFAFIIGQLPFVIEWAGRPSWLIALTAFVVWFIAETVFYWVGIQAFSKSSLPVFPPFHAMREKASWPNQKHCIQVKEWIQEQGYQWVQSLKSDIHPALEVEANVYQSKDSDIRLQVIIMPQRVPGIRLQYVFSTKFEDGRFFVTDNFSLPFGGYYLYEWSIKRKPLMTSIAKLEALHKDRLCGEANIVPWGDDPEADFKEEYSILEKYNVQAHFFYELALREEKGKLTYEGRYRLWKEMWLMNYFGIAVSS